MKKKIIIKFGELSLKGTNKKDFIKKLHSNIKRAFEGINDWNLVKKYEMFELDFSESNQSKHIEILKRIPGISVFYLVYEIERDESLIEDSIKNILINGALTFKVDARRSDKRYPKDSMQLAREIGGIVLKNFSNYKVDIKKPQLTIFFTVTNFNFVISTSKFKGVGGLPVGINGKALVLLSGGIDSPVAGYLLNKRGISVDYLTFITPPHTSEKVIDKTKDLLKAITLNNTIDDSTLHLCNFSPLQHEIAHISNNSYQITLMRRYFFRIAEHLSEAHNYGAIATGEALGQVASQTLESMNTISHAVKDVLVLRPLLTYDKEEIIEIARKIGTYNISILPYDDSCSLFVPKNPVTKPKPKVALKLETELELINTIFNSIIKNNITTWKVNDGNKK